MENRAQPAQPAISRRAMQMDFRMVEGENGKRIIRGHGSVFDSMSEDLGGFREIIHRGAFDKALATSDIRCLKNHDANLILGRTASGTLRVTLDELGLAYECDMPDTSYARDLAVSLDRRDITQSSFAFSMNWEDEKNYQYEYLRQTDEWILHIYSVEELFDVSPVTYPAYKAADVRSAVVGLERAKAQFERELAAQKVAEVEAETVQELNTENETKMREQIRKAKYLLTSAAI